MKKSIKLGFTLATAAIAAQSTILSATRNPQSTIRSAIRTPQSKFESAIRNPQSAIREWRSLFDGQSLETLAGYNAARIPDGWHICNGKLAEEKSVADIVSMDQFEHF